MNSRLTKNCEKIGVEEVRTAVCEKLSQLPFPNAKPATMKTRITSTFMDVRTFCTRAARCTPRQLRIVKTATSEQARICDTPSLNSHAPDQQHQLHGTEIAGQIAGGGENAAADHV